MNQLMPLENVNAIEIYSNSNSIQSVLDEIENQATDFTPDTSTPDGRKEIASQAYLVSRSKSVLDNAGKDLTQEWAKKKKLVDASRKVVRDFCDNLRDKIRQPLTEWEDAENLLAQQAALKAEKDADELEAYERNEVFDGLAKIKAYDERIEEERIEKERIEAERIAEENRKNRDEQIRKDAAEEAERRAEQAEQEKKDAIEREKLAKELAEKQVKEQAEQAERDRIEAAARAEREKQDAIKREKQRARAEADRVEVDRLRRIEDEKIEAQRRAANIENRRKINRQIVAALVEGGVSKTAATKVVTLVAKGEVPAMSIRY